MKLADLAKANTELAHQTALFAWAAKAALGGLSFANEVSLYPEPALAIPELKLMFAIPNGGTRHPAEAARLKTSGVKSGVPDIFLPCVRYIKYNDGECSDKFWAGLFIEMKRSKTDKTSRGVLSPEQQGFLILLQAAGYHTAVCYSYQEAVATIIAYLGVKQ